MQTQQSTQRLIGRIVMKETIPLYIDPEHIPQLAIELGNKKMVYIKSLMRTIDAYNVDYIEVAVATDQDLQNISSQKKKIERLGKYIKESGKDSLFLTN